MSLVSRKTRKRYVLENSVDLTSRTRNAADAGSHRYIEDSGCVVAASRRTIRHLREF